MDAVQRESQSQLAAMTTRLQELQRAADALKADYESRLAEGRQAVEKAAARGAAECRSLRERLAAVLQDCAALTSARDEFQTALTAAVAARDAAVAERQADAQRLHEMTGRVDEVAGERDDARRRLDGLEQTVRDVTEREAAVRREMAAGLADWTARNEAHEQAAVLQRQSAGEAAAAWSAEREDLLRRLSGQEQQLTEAQRTVAERDAQLAESAKQRETLLAEVSRIENSRVERADQRKREVGQTARHLGESRAELAAAREALAAERERSAAMEKRLAGEIKALQRDLHALAMVKTAARRLRDEHAAAGPMIDWLAGGSAAAAAAGGAEGDDKFAGLNLSQQVDLLHQELRLSVDDKERLRRDLEKVRADYLDLERRSEARGLELGAKITQLQNEFQSNAPMVQQTLEELERRESAARQYRKKAEEREKELQERIMALEAELTRAQQAPAGVIEGEWQAPPRPAGTPPREEAPRGNGAKGKPAATMLNSVEAQLRGELEKWHTLEQDKDRTKAKPQQWFRWKKS